MKKNGVLNNMMRDRQATTALSVPRSIRPHNNAFLSRMYPGKVVPIAAAGLFREDAVARGRIAAIFEMSETAEVLINPVHVKMSAYLVPWLAFDRFNGRDEFEASYSQVPFKEGDDVIDFIETMARGVEGDHPILDALGLHAAETQDVSTMYIEAYNKIINYRNENMSLDLVADGASTLRTRLQSDLAPAQREIGRHRNIVPSFDEASMEGAVDINFIGGSFPLEGMGKVTSTNTHTTPLTVTESDGQQHTYAESANTQHSPDGVFRVEMNSDGTPNMRVNINGDDMTFSLAHIERARKMQVFAQLRQQFSGLGDNDEETINKLMDGIRMPDKMFEQPIYLGSEKATFGFQKRYSSDSTNLDESVVQGMTRIQMEFATPRINTGGVLMFVAEIQPEQLYERQPDPFFVETDVSKYPQTMRDELDEQKVDRVLNKEIDTAHTDPDGLFGYGPLNGRWMVDAPRIGTGYYKAAPSAVFDEDRNRIWETSPTDPELGADWYLTNDLPTDVFTYTESEPFEASGQLQLAISGNTVFGRTLIESDGDYDAIADRVPTEQIEQSTT